MAMEIWDIRDKKGIPTGRTIRRGQPLQPGEYHLVVHIWVVNKAGELLVQKRAEHLDFEPGIWATTGGSALAGEDSQQAMLRELKEELGIAAAPGEFVKLKRLVRKDSILDIWLVRKEVDLDEVALQPEEVSAVKYISPGTMLELAKDGAFHNYGREYFQFLLKEIVWVANQHLQE